MVIDGNVLGVMCEWIEVLKTVILSFKLKRFIARFLVAANK